MDYLGLTDALKRKESGVGKRALEIGSLERKLNHVSLAVKARSLAD